MGDEVSGKVEGLFSALKEGNISLLALKDSLIGTELAKPDRNGRFVFDRLEYPSGTQYIVQALSKKGSSKVFIELDPYKSFPAPKIGFIPRIEKPHIEENYMAKMDQKYTTSIPQLFQKIACWTQNCYYDVLGLYLNAVFLVTSHFFPLPHNAT